MRFSNTKATFILLVLLSAILFLGGIAINLVSESIGASLKGLLGESYRFLITVACIVFAIIAGLVAWLQLKHSDHTQQDASKKLVSPQIVINSLEVVKSSDHSESEGENEYRQEPLPDEIIGQIRKLPPFQRPITTQSYIGLKVAWQLRLMHISKTDTTYTITMDVSDTSMCIVRALINIDTHPEAKILNTGHRILAKGKISEIDENINCIGLVNPIFAFE
jgi:hypothetical protein